MKKSLFILLLLCLAMPSLADDTVYCPTDQRERATKCEQAKDKNRQIDETVANWTPMLNDGNMMMYRITRAKNESPDQYANRVKSMKSFSYRGLNYPIRGKYTTKGVTFIPLTRQESSSVLGRAFESRREVEKQMNYVRQNTQKLKPMIRNKIDRLEHEKQQNMLYLAQCCGYRWTTEGERKRSGGKTVQNRPAQPNAPSGGQRGLLGVESDEQRHSGNGTVR